MKRIQSIILLALCAVTATAFCQQKPNIVILYADDMGYGDLGANNPKSKIPTPHLDRLAASGMILTDGHSSSGICSPSRYALLRMTHDIDMVIALALQDPEILSRIFGDELYFGDPENSRIQFVNRRKERRPTGGIASVVMIL